MKKISVLALSLLMFSSIVFAGGIVTNTNQSADFIRSLNRNASTDIDAAYFNPAGLTAMDNGLHLYFSSQTVTQDREITSDLATLHNSMFKGSTFAPVFPNFYLAYKTGDIVLSAGFVPIGGGGSANFEDGLPSFEVPVSLIPMSLSAAGIPTTDYSLDVAFEGSSVYMGGQAALSWKMSDKLSLAAGVRYFQAKNTYKGHLKDIQINPNKPEYGFSGSLTSASGVFTTLAGITAGAAAQYAAGATTVTGYAAQAQGGADALQPFIDGGAGSVSFANLLAAGQVTQAQIDAIAAGVVAFGGSFDAATSTPATTQAFYQSMANYFTGYAVVLSDSSTYYTAVSAANLEHAAATEDLEVDVEQTAASFSPLFGLYYTPFKGLGIGLRYEGKAAMQLENKTKSGASLYPDGALTNADMPAMLGLGISYKVMKSLRLEVDYNVYYYDGVHWAGDKQNYVDNGTEFGVGADFALSNSILLSAGFLSSVSGATADYQTDMSHSLNSTTMGFGGRYSLSPKMAVSLGVSNTSYEKFTKTVQYATGVSGEETYFKTTLDIALGLAYSF